MAAELEKLIVSLQADLKQYEKEMARAQGITTTKLRAIERQAQLSSNKIEQGFARVGASIKGSFVGALGALSVEAVARAIGGLINKLGELHDEADRAGVDAKSLQAIGYAARGAGTNVEELVTSMQKFNLEIGEAATKGGDLADVLRLNGIAMRDSAGNMRAPLELFFDYVDLIARAKSDQEAATLAQIGFGRAVKDQIPFYRLGSAEIKRLMDAARETSAVVSNELVKTGDEITDSWSQMWDRWSGLAMTAIATVASVMSQSLKVNQRAGGILGTLALGELESPSQKMIDLITLGEKRKILEQQIADKMVDQPGLAEQLRVKLQGVVDQMVKINEELTKSYQLSQLPSTMQRNAYEVQKAVVFPDPEAAARKAEEERLRKAAEAAAKQEAEAIKKVIEQLKFEYDQMRLSQLQQKINIELRKAGAAATEEEKKQIADLVTKQHELDIARERNRDELAALAAEQQKATDEMAEYAKQMRDAFKDAFVDLIQGARDGKLSIQDLIGVLDSLASKLIQMAAEKLFMMALNIALGTPAGPAPTPNYADILAGKASGGPVSGGKPYMVGEEGPEMFVPSSSGTILPAGSGSGSGSMTVNVTNMPGVMSKQRRSSSGGHEMVDIVNSVMEKRFPELLNRNSGLIGARPTSRRTY